MKILQETKQKRSVGRPTVDTPELRQKIEEVTALDASIEEVAFYAGISRETYYQIIKKDKVFSDRLEALRNKPVLKARQTAIQKLGESYQNAMDYLKRKRKLEFGDNIDITSDNLPLPLLSGKTNVQRNNRIKKVIKPDEEDSGCEG
jgi:predicted DNA-binding protein YlxM (UPF0122 family)